MTLFRDAAHYSKNSSVQQSESNYLINKIQLEFMGKKLLDVGSGDGKISNLMSNMGAKVSGIDASSDMVKFAINKYPNCQFYKENAEELFKHQNDYQIITSFNCLHWVSEIGKTLHGIRARLVNDGIFLGLIYPRCTDLWDAADWCESLPLYMELSKSFTNPYHFHTKEGMRSLLSKSGFHKITLWEEERQTRFKTQQEFINYIIGWLPHYGHYGQSFIKPWFNKYIELSQQQSSKEVIMSYQTIFFTAS
ncbi:class I SAM-dependent methyltransferase [Vibrio pectenicida]|uniref:Class I SAM-dependent methyltransferase n=1 Tax=Vibrio pectenicida TaxID=62763 RepID=A0A3R9EFT2_9VIBR|nr:class I SAM-dependent methyltransferase [Vibrio pectenicida]RSD32848.1 class I SAM-dependent methyltransferase [Vibrio pectenicida]